MTLSLLCVSAILSVGVKGAPRESDIVTAASKLNRDVSSGSVARGAMLFETTDAPADLFLVCKFIFPPTRRLILGVKSLYLLYTVLVLLLGQKSLKIL